MGAFASSDARNAVSDGVRSCDDVSSSDALLLQAKSNATFKLQKAPALHRDNSYYAKDTIDGYAKCRLLRAGDIKTTKLDADLFQAILNCLHDDGKIDSKELETMIMPKIRDGRGGKAELTCNERWTIRYALGEFNWDFDARLLLLNSMHDMHVLNAADNAVTGEEKKLVMFGPSLEVLQQPPAKKGAGAEKLFYVDGMNLDREMLLAASEGVANDRVIDAAEAIKIFRAAADEANVLTRCERWTLRFILSSHVFTDAAFNFLKEAMSTLQETDTIDAD